MMKNDPRKHLGEQVLGQVVQAEEPEHIDRGDLRDVGQHDDRRDGQAPAADPPDPRSERLGAPGERRSAIGSVLRQFLVGEGDQQHRDECEHEHRWSFLADCEHDVAERGGQAVRGCHCCQPDDDVAEEAQGTCLQSLVADDCRRRFLDCHARNIRFRLLLWRINTQIVPGAGVCDGLRRNCPRLDSNRDRQYPGRRVRAAAPTSAGRGVPAHRHRRRRRGHRAGCLAALGRQLRCDRRPAGMADDGGQPARP